MIALSYEQINLGSGQYPLEGWTNVDQWCDADIEQDMFACEFRDVSRVRMSHVLEHVSWRKTEQLLEHVRSWMRPGGDLYVEVPDIAAILDLGTSHPLWFKYVYGDQSHPGEYHQAGFTVKSLVVALAATGWKSIAARRFVSDHPGREGMPCIAAEARA